MWGQRDGTKVKVHTELAVANYDHDLNPGITHDFQNSARYSPVAESGVTKMHTCTPYTLWKYSFEFGIYKQNTKGGEFMGWCEGEREGNGEKKRGKEKERKINECFIWEPDVFLGKSFWLVWLRKSEHGIFIDNVEENWRVRKQGEMGIGDHEANFCWRFFSLRLSIIGCQS